MNLKEKIYNFINKVSGRLIFPTCANYADYLRSRGVKVGKGFRTFSTDVRIDVSMPELVEIGDNVRINYGFLLMTHDDVSAVTRNVYHNFVQNKEKVKIGNNVDFGMNVTVLKGVTIGDNVFVGLGSVVSKDLPSNCIAIGSPARPICSLDQYWEKQNKRHEEVTFRMIEAIEERGRKVNPRDMAGCFSLFIDGSNYQEYPEVPVRYQLQDNFDHWCRHHKRKYGSFDALMDAAHEWQMKKAETREENV